MNDQVDNRTFGRVYLEDPRDNDYLIEDVIPQDGLPDIRRKFWWAEGWSGDQGRTSQCVVYSWSHWLEDGPVIQDVIPGRRKPMFDTTEFYNLCQRWDQIPGENYDGTTVRAGAKILQKLGVIGEYRWARTVDDVIATVTHIGPMVVGTQWTSNMTKPTSHRHIMRPTGADQGGHAYLINGVDSDKELFRVKNSWGRDWADNGHAYISFRNFEKLLQNRGEACVAFENKVSQVPSLDSL